ncbi:FGGY family carbohydrate kinase [Herbiconiux moechotypicola]|uniref:FGGY family carbohydrate kinase n=1 Tax=Herbiconiux moechotypicola TaxID=637393 RepID=A0ABN3D988_9MICO|nr:FGGY family carbohydrate kinase [Herbiconiux moechotypicola]MCS5728202.1 FGGY family carbohydrate kinase [Herbiconiux moechotypicola]
MTGAGGDASPFAHDGFALGLDVGSHGVRAVVIDAGARTIASSSADYAGALPPARRPLGSIADALESAMAALPIGVRTRIRTIGVTGVRGSVVGLERQGTGRWHAVTEVLPDFEPAVQAEAEALRDRYGDALAERTGCPAFPLSGLPKILAGTGYLPGATWVSVQDAVGWLLTGALVCSTGSALRLGVLTRDGGEYDRALLAELGLADHVVAPLVAIGDQVGTIEPRVAARHRLSSEVRVVAAPGDGPAALRALDSLPDARAGSALVTLGTSTVVLAPRADDGTQAVPYGFTLEVLGDGRRSIETGDGSGMANVDWAANLLGVRPHELDALGQEAVPGDGLRMELPSMDVWGVRREGSIVGFGRDFGRAELARSVLDFVADGAVGAIERVGAIAPFEAVALTGGGARSTTIVERIRRRIDVPVTLVAEPELAARGAALVALPGRSSAPARRMEVPA